MQQAFSGPQAVTSRATLLIRLAVGRLSFHGYQGILELMPGGIWLRHGFLEARSEVTVLILR